MAPAGVSKGQYLISLKRAELSVCDEAASFLQSFFWGAFKARFGWEALAFTAGWNTRERVQTGEGADRASVTRNVSAACAGVENKSNDEADEKPLLVLRRPLAAGFSLVYIPWGPELPACFYTGEKSEEACTGALKELAAALRKSLPFRPVFIRFDPPWYTEGGDQFPPPLPSPFIHSGADIQPPDTVLVNLNQPMESILEQMKPKWRYNGRLAIKKGISLRRAGAEEIGVFYGLLKETARRDGIAIHGIEYYRALFESGRYSGKTPDIRLYLAEHEGDVLAGIVTLFREKGAVYLYGASSNIKRNLMAPYALQIKAMEDAKACGCAEYDLFGIPPNDDPSHPMAGLYRFKTGFGGRIIHRPGSWDYPCRPFVYSLFRRAETLRKNLRTIKKKIRR